MGRGSAVECTVDGRPNIMSRHRRKRIDRSVLGEILALEEVFGEVYTYEYNKLSQNRGREGQDQCSFHFPLTNVEKFCT